MSENENTDLWSVVNSSKQKKRIVETTMEIFDCNNSFNASDQELLLRLEMKKPNLYYHIISKEHLLRMIFAYYYQELLNSVKLDFPYSKHVGDRLEYMWIKRARWAFNNPTPMKFIYYRMALESSSFIEYWDDLLKKTMISGIQSRKLIGYQNHNYLICLFHAAFNSVIISLIGKRYGSNQKIMIVKKAFTIFYEQIRRNILEPNDY